jgi:putative thioredoxin
MPEPASQPAAPAPVSWILDVDARSFQKEVLERSLSVPVVVDFWAAWCGPCKALGPALEKAARAGQGRFVLARVDVDKSPELAGAFRVQGIPTVLVVVKGKIADGFEGALPERELQRFLDQVVPAKGADPAEKARALAAEGKLREAIQALEGHVQSSPDDERALILLAGLHVQAGDAEEAELVLRELSDVALQSPEVRAIRAQLDFSGSKGDLGRLEEARRQAPHDVDARVAYGKALVAADQRREGLEELLEGVRLEPEKKDGRARKAMLEVFDLLGLEDPLANEYRFKLSLVLFA